MLDPFFSVLVYLCFNGGDIENIHDELPRVNANTCTIIFSSDTSSPLVKRFLRMFGAFDKLVGFDTIIKILTNCLFLQRTIYVGSGLKNMYRRVYAVFSVLGWPEAMLLSLYDLMQNIHRHIQRAVSRGEMGRNKRSYVQHMSSKPKHAQNPLPNSALRSLHSPCQVECHISL